MEIKIFTDRIRNWIETKRKYWYFVHFFKAFNCKRIINAYNEIKKFIFRRKSLNILLFLKFIACLQFNLIKLYNFNNTEFVYYHQLEFLLLWSILVKTFDWFYKLKKLLKTLLYTNFCVFSKLFKDIRIY